VIHNIRCVWPMSKYYRYFIAINVLLLLIAALGLGVPPENLPFYIAIIALSSVFGFFCKGWQRFFAICFVIVGLLMSFKEVERGQIFNERMERIKKAVNNDVKTNTPVPTASTNSVH